MLITYSHSTCATARLFFLKSLFREGDKHIIITDSDADMRIWQDFGHIFFSERIHRVADIAGFWYMIEAKQGIHVLPLSLLETGGNIEYIRRHSIFEIQRGTTLSSDSTIEKLIEYGYQYAEYTGELGTYKKEGSTVTYTDTTSGITYAIEWFDTEIDSIIELDPRAGTRIFRESITLKNTKIDTTPIVQKEGSLNTELIELLSGGAQKIFIGGDFHQEIETLRSTIDIHFTDFYREDAISLDVAVPDIGHIDVFLSFLREHGNKKHIEIYSKNPRPIQDFIDFHQIDGVQVKTVAKIGLESCIIPEQPGQKNTKTHDLIVITDDILGEIFVRTRERKSIAKNLDLILSLNPGDLVVHREHGIARFHAVVKKTVAEISREYLELHYALGDKLFVPLTEIYRVSKYLGNPDVELTRLTGKEWERTIDKTEEEIEVIARDILETSARRTLAKGHAFAKFRDKEKILREAFPYEYTPDQKSAIDDVMADMESAAPMDRLISGDVGFGKTEVAMNAVYKAVLGGTQVAVISPLLVLADEHYETFVERLSPFGIRVAVMTRMNSEKEIKETIKGLKAGTIDVVVGTHRIFSDDVRYHRLGLLVIDEEHKFGVAHKEKIKKLKSGVDILTLSATPIPRSLNLALSGLKKISLLTTPPKRKKPIQTIVNRWNESIIASAIRTELARGGQVIIVHNRIRGMESIATELQEIMRAGGMMTKKQAAKTPEGETKKDIHPSPHIIITHGQMPGDDIEERIHAFKKGEYNILLTTTIIENGVNFLSANTIIIIDPEEFGLASLHQLRGRVGRRDQEGFCYLMYRKPELSTDEKKRLITIANNTHLGAGFEIAMRDMEIRGAGDVLGIKQSGKSKDVGLTLYFRMLEERIEELKNERKKRPPVRIELDISCVIGDEYFLSETDKLNFFREIENIENIEELEEIESNFLQNHQSHTDTSLSNLFVLLRARLILSEYGVTRVSRVGLNYVFDFIPTIRVDRIRDFLERFDRKKDMVLLSNSKIRIETRYFQGAVDFLEQIAGG